MQGAYNTRSCGSGSFWNGNACSSINPSGSFIITINIGGGTTSRYPVCASGCYFHPPSGMCIRGTRTTASSCRQNQVWNGVGCSDVGNSNSCSAGNYYSGSGCQSVNSVLLTLCGSNQFWNGRSCTPLVGSGSQNCQGGYYFKPYKCCLNNY